MTAARREPVVIFSGSPVWTINLHLIVGCSVWLVLVQIAVGESSPRGLAVSLWLWAVMTASPWLHVAVAMTRTSCTQILIDEKRIRISTGVFRRDVRSLELFRVVNVASSSSCWERLLGFGTLALETSDGWHPRWVLRGLPEVESLRDELNLAAIEVREVKGIREVNVGRV